MTGNESKVKIAGAISKWLNKNNLYPNEGKYSSHSFTTLFLMKQHVVIVVKQNKELEKALAESVGPRVDKQMMKELSGCIEDQRLNEGSLQWRGVVTDGRRWWIWDWLPDGISPTGIEGWQGTVLSDANTGRLIRVLDRKEDTEDTMERAGSVRTESPQAAPSGDDTGVTEESGREEEHNDSTDISEEQSSSDSKFKVFLKKAALRVWLWPQCSRESNDKEPTGEPNDEEVPIPFQPRSHMGWLKVFYIPLITMFIYYIVLGNPGPVLYYGSGAADILLINAEILVTALAVTLGATLLGIQFRAQSYTMLALMRQMNNSVVYAFIALFVSLIVINLLLVVVVPVKVLPVGIPFMFLGTAFSMVYLTGYVYHMIHRLQPHEMMEQVTGDIKEKLEKWVNYNIENDANMKKSINGKFAVWEQIMLRAVELDNVTMFKNGLDKILGQYDTSMKKLRKDSEANTGESERIEVLAKSTDELFLQHIKEVMSECVRRDRDTCCTIFLEAFSVDKHIPRKKEDIGRYTLGMFSTWHEIMRISIINDKEPIIHLGMDYMSKKMEEWIKKWQMRWFNIFFHDWIAPLAVSAIGRNNAYLLRYLEALSKYDFPEYGGEIIATTEKIPEGIALFGDEPYTNFNPNRMQNAIFTSMEMWSMIMNRAYGSKDLLVFNSGLQVIKNSLERGGTDIKYTMTVNSLSNVMNNILGSCYRSAGNWPLAADVGMHTPQTEVSPSPSNTTNGEKSVSPLNRSDLICDPWARRCISLFVKSFVSIYWGRNNSRYLWIFGDARLGRLWMTGMRTIIVSEEIDVAKYCLQKIKTYMEFLYTDSLDDSEVDKEMLSSLLNTHKQVIANNMSRLENFRYSANYNDNGNMIMKTLEELRNRYLNISAFYHGGSYGDLRIFQIWKDAACSLITTGHGKDLIEMFNVMNETLKDMKKYIESRGSIEFMPSDYDSMIEKLEELIKKITIEDFLIFAEKYREDSHVINNQNYGMLRTTPKLEIYGALCLAKKKDRIILPAYNRRSLYSVMDTRSNQMAARLLEYLRDALPTNKNELSIMKILELVPPYEGELSTEETREICSLHEEAKVVLEKELWIGGEAISRGSIQLSVHSESGAPILHISEVSGEHNADGEPEESSGEHRIGKSIPALFQRYKLHTRELSKERMLTTTKKMIKLQSVNSSDRNVDQLRKELDQLRKELGGVEEGSSPDVNMWERIISASEDATDVLTVVDVERVGRVYNELEESGYLNLLADEKGPTGHWAWGWFKRD